MKKSQIYALPEKYIERQRIIKALQDPLRELVMWFYHTEEEKKIRLWGVYLDRNETLSGFFYDVKTLQRVGYGTDPNTGEREISIDSLYKYLHKEVGVTELLGYALGIKSNPPPKPEGKIIQFPVPAIKAKRRRKKEKALPEPGPAHAGELA